MKSILKRGDKNPRPTAATAGASNTSRSGACILERPLAQPLRVSEVYAEAGQAVTLFRFCSDYLTKEEISNAFPSGLITHQRIILNNRIWQIVGKAITNISAPRTFETSNVYLAILEESNGQVDLSSGAFLPLPAFDDSTNAASALVGKISIGSSNNNNMTSISDKTVSFNSSPSTSALFCGSSSSSSEDHHQDTNYENVAASFKIHSSGAPPKLSVTQELIASHCFSMEDSDASEASALSPSGSNGAASHRDINAANRSVIVSSSNANGSYKMTGTCYDPLDNDMSKTKTLGNGDSLQVIPIGSNNFTSSTLNSGSISSSASTTVSESRSGGGVATSHGKSSADVNNYAPHTAHFSSYLSSRSASPGFSLKPPPPQQQQQQQAQAVETQPQFHHPQPQQQLEMYGSAQPYMRSGFDFLGRIGSNTGHMVSTLPNGSSIRFLGNSASLTGVSSLSLSHSHSHSHSQSFSPSSSASPPPASYASSNLSTFMADLVTATDSVVPLDRYKAFLRLFSSLRRQREAEGMVDGRGVYTWLSHPDAREVLTRVIMVGECLAKFSTADFMLDRGGSGGVGGHNGSRAITNRDYAELLRMFVLQHGDLLLEDVVRKYPMGALQDDATAVRCLLKTRCESNEVLFEQLVKQVGKEVKVGGASVVVHNAATAAANPSTQVVASPKTLVQAASHALSQVDSSKRTQLGALGAVAVVALWVLKKRIVGGGGGAGGTQKRRGGEGLMVAPEAFYSPFARGGLGGGGDIATRLLDERNVAERSAVRQLSACQIELRKARKNEELLSNDWRLGKIRLAWPPAPHPIGYEPLDQKSFDLDTYLNRLDSSSSYISNANSYNSSTNNNNNNSNGLNALSLHSSPVIDVEARVVSTSSTPNAKSSNDKTRVGNYQTALLALPPPPQTASSSSTAGSSSSEATLPTAALSSSSTAASDPAPSLLSSRSSNASSKSYGKGDEGIGGNVISGSDIRRGLLAILPIGGKNSAKAT